MGAWEFVTIKGITGKGGTRLNVLAEKAKEVLYSVLPITVIVIILHFTIAPVGNMVLGRFLMGTFLVTVGLSVFLVGVDMGITPIGRIMGRAVAKTNRLWVVIAGGLILGFFVSIAEPDLHILASQVEAVTGGAISKLSIVIAVSAGIALMLTIGLLRIVFSIPLYRLLTACYLAVLALAFFSSQEFLAISFDASGATTGAMTVPFILALAVGVSAMEKDSKGSEKDSFGLVAIASVGAILSVMAMSIVRGRAGIAGEVSTGGLESDTIIWPFIQSLGHIALEILIALSPIVILFTLSQLFLIRTPKKTLARIAVGLLFTLIGLTLFLSGVNNGFMDVGLVLGEKIASFESKAPLVAVGFLLGFVTILAEPAVHVLTDQIEDVTSGYVRRRIVLMTLALGVGAAVALSMLRIATPGIRLWHYLLPGYAISVLLMFFVPKLFVGIAFDSGGVASGPMTATFILAFAQGAADAIEGASVVADGFGMIAMVALTPLIALQILGGIFKLTTGRREGKA